VQVWVYLISSILCWLAAVIMMARFNSAGADIAQSYLLITVLAAILGGVDPYGGFGRITGLFVALWMLQVIASGFNLMNVSPHLALASWGVILLLVMTVKRFAPALRLLRGRNTHGRKPHLACDLSDDRKAPSSVHARLAGPEPGSGGDDHDQEEGPQADR
jgi:simple sugar transport system permease protein